MSFWRSSYTCTVLAFILALYCIGTSAAGLNLGGSVNMGTWSAQATRYEYQRRICAWSTVSTAFYRVIANTAQSAENFALFSDLGNSIRFDVSWRDAEVSSGWERLLPGLPSSRRYAFSNAIGCQGDDTGFQIRLSKSDADGAMHGSYSNTLMITLIVE